jgi:hypothetical protein
MTTSIRRLLASIRRLRRSIHLRASMDSRRHAVRSPRHVRDAGMATAEYAIATLAACGFAGLLLTLMRSDEVRGLLLSIVRRALSVG